MLKRLLVLGVVSAAALAAVPSVRARVGSALGATQAAQQPGDTFIQSARRLLAHGRVDEAEALAKARPAGEPEAAAVLARIYASRGQYDEALKMLETAAAAQPAGEAALELGLLLQQHYGKPSRGPALQSRPQPRRRSRRIGEALFRAARAAGALGQMQDANTLFRAAARSADPAVETAWGELFLETYNPPEALRSFQQVLKARRPWAPAHLGAAQTLANENPPAAAAAAEQALKIDPNYADAELFLAELDLDNTRYAEARKRIDRVLARNPSHLDARALARRDRLRARRCERVRGGSEARARHQSRVRRGLSRRRRVSRRATIASTRRWR